MPLTGSPSPAQTRLVEGFFRRSSGAAKTPESYTNPTLARPDKQKCKQCFMRRIAGGKARDEKEVAAGQRGSISIRDENTIKHTCVFFSLVNAL
jgi:hypothetical protein